MLSTIITLLSLGVMLLMIAGFIISALRERQPYVYAGVVQAQHASLPSHDKTTAVHTHMQNGAVTGSGRPASPSVFLLPPSWYKRWRAFISLGFLLMILLALFAQSGLSDGLVRDLKRGFLLLSDYSQSADIHTLAHTTQVNASKQFVRISQLDPNQYATTDEYNAWAYSACSAAAMTEVFNAYGRHLRVTDVLGVEARIGEITPELGLVRREGIEHTAAQFGFKTTWGNSWTLDQVIATANSSKPVIVDFPPDRYAGGHILDVIGGNNDYVYLADTSLWNRHAITRTQFLSWWAGYAAVVTPN